MIGIWFKISLYIYLTLTDKCFTLSKTNEQSLTSQLMPRGKKGVKTDAKRSERSVFYSNIYSIQLKSINSIIYQYVMFTEPDIPKDSSALRDKIIRSIFSDLKKHLGYVCSKGEMIWGRKNEQKVLTLVSEFTKEEVKHKYQILIKPVKEIGLQHFIYQNPDKMAAVCQVLNINTKNLLKDKKMVELSIGNYFDPEAINQNVSSESGLSVWRGYKINVAAYNSKLYIQVDACSRVLREQNFLVTLEKDRKKLSHSEMNDKYKGASILVKFGNLKMYKIQEIDFQQNPKSKFYCTRDNKDITYLQYYKTRYGILIKHENQPLLKVLGEKKKMTETQNIQKFVYLIPEMLTLTGLSESQKSDYKIMKSIDMYTKMTPQNRMFDSEGIIQKLRGSPELMFAIKNQPEKLQGYKMNDPIILAGGNRNINIRNGQINLREKILDPHIFKNYAFCYSIGKNPDYDQEDADDALGYLKTAAKSFDIILKQPYWIEVPGKNANDWKRELDKQKDKQKDLKFQIIIFFFQPNEQSMYSDLKKYTSQTFNCPSQFIRKRTLSKNTKGVLSCASKIILQMNVKQGHALWKVPNDHPFWKDSTKKVAIAGIASSKGKMGNAIGLVGTIDNDLTRYFCDCKLIKSRDNLSVALFRGLFTLWMQNYFMKNQKKLPTEIIVYREGLNDIQAKMQFEAEVQGLIETLQIVKKKANIPNYSPHIIYLLVNKNPNSRIFQKQNNGKTSTYKNPQPGSVIFQDLSRQNMKQFHMASVSVREGTCNPVEYKIGYDNFIYPLDALAELTYNQCYCYYNWTGAVRVPASLQYANKLSKQYSQIGDQLIGEQKNSDLKTKAFFL